MLITRDICTGALEGLTLSSGSMDKSFRQTHACGADTVLRLPDATSENPGNIASTCQYLRKSYRAQSHPFTLKIVWVIPFFIG